MTAEMSDHTYPAGGEYDTLGIKLVTQLGGQFANL
jgi:hypothetical protein